MSDQPLMQRPRCMHLCCKSMVVFGEAFADDPDFQAGMTDFWCLRTQKGLGPDNGDVSLEHCTQADRGCFQEF
jgi:hypothetical protein